MVWRSFNGVRIHRRSLRAPGDVLDQTRTSPGARKLRRWILTPLKERHTIEMRHGAVESLYRDQVRLARLREALAGVLDLERLTARVAMERAHAKDLLAIKSTLQAVLTLGGLLAGGGAAGTPDGLADLAEAIASRAGLMTDLTALLDNAINEEPAVVLTEGNLIKRGFNTELDRLHSLKDNAREILDTYLAEERTQTGISSLKLRYNKIIGYYFEVTK